jgi:phosphatidylglycerol:prolipoprotein diacylglycerol transferase
LRTTPYTWLLLAGIIVGAVVWSRIARRDCRLLAIYFAALSGAFLGTKIVYFFAEGYQHIGAPDFWLQLATGKSILGGLIGGYLAVELTKPLVDYRGITGDWFAIVTPVGITFGRVGCLLHGCCAGVVCTPSWFTLCDQTGTSRWPSVPIEIVFNIAAAVTFFILRKRRLLPGQHFHIYQIAYGTFRFLHEFVREEPKVIGPFSGYQFFALVLVVFGIVAFIHRKKSAGAMSAPAHAIVRQRP